MKYKIISRKIREGQRRKEIYRLHEGQIEIVRYIIINYKYICTVKTALV